MSDNLIRLCALAEVPEGGTLKVDVEQFELAVFNLSGKIFVTDDHCTHGPGSLSEGYVEDDEIECDFHGGRFKIATGEVAGPPCMIPVQTYTVQVVDGDVFIERTLPPLAACPLSTDASTPEMR